MRPADWLVEQRSLDQLPDRLRRAVLIARGQISCQVLLACWRRSARDRAAEDHLIAQARRVDDILAHQHREMLESGRFAEHVEESHVNRGHAQRVPLY